MIEYQLTERIGTGGMGEVYRASEILPNGKRIPVACKLLKRPLRGERALIDGFRKEAEINRRISHNHPGLVSLHHWVQAQPGGQDFLIMELVDGCSLRELLDHAQHGATMSERLPFEMVRLIARDVLDTLGYVHRRGLNHRDISPGNVLISLQGEVKLADLGLARAPDGEQERQFVGKPAYAGPEALPGRIYDERSDLYSFGSMLYEMLTGAPPFGERVTLGQLLARRIPDDWQVPPLSDYITADLRTLAIGLLHGDRDRRTPATATEAREAIRPPLHSDKARVELSNVATELHDRARQRRKADEPGSHVGVRLVALHVSADRPDDSDARLGQPRQISAGCMARILGIALLAAAALGGLVLGLYRHGAGSAPTTSTATTSAAIVKAAESTDVEPVEITACTSAPSPTSQDGKRSPASARVVEETSTEPPPRTQRRRSARPRRVQQPPIAIDPPRGWPAGEASTAPTPNHAGLHRAARIVLEPSR